MTIADRLTDLNRWYEGLPDDRRIFVYPGVLLAAALVNARWTGSPFGWVFFAALAALVVIRRSYVSGYLKSEALADGPAAKAASAPRAFVPPPAPVQPVAKPAPAPAPVAPPVVAQPAAAPAPQAAPPPPAAPAPVAAQPAAKPAPPPPVHPAVASTPTVDGPAPRPVPAAAAATPKKNVQPPPRKNDGRSGRRKPGDKHP